MSLVQHRRGWVIFFSFLIALALTIMPLPGELELFRPEWVALVLIYWCMALPSRVGVASGWFAGLVLDVSRDALLGEHALALALIAFLTLHLHQRVRVFPLWQQSLSVFVLIMLQGLIILWSKGFIGESPGFLNMMASAVTSMMVWPVVYILLRHTRRTYQVT